MAELGGVDLGEGVNVCDTGRAWMMDLDTIPLVAGDYVALLMINCSTHTSSAFFNTCL